MNSDIEIEQQETSAVTHNWSQTEAWQPFVLLTLIVCDYFFVCIFFLFIYSFDCLFNSPSLTH